MTTDVENLIWAFSESYKFEDLSFEQRKAILDSKEAEIQKLRNIHNQIKNKENALEGKLAGKLRGRPKVWSDEALMRISWDVQKIMEEPDLPILKKDGREIAAYREYVLRVCRDFGKKTNKKDVHDTAKALQKAVRGRFPNNPDQNLSEAIFTSKNNQN